MVIKIVREIVLEALLLYSMFDRASYRVSFNW